MLMLIVLFTVSCKKDFYNQPNGPCLITHYEETLYGYSVDIFYNSQGNPDSLSFSGFGNKLEYDNRGRLVKQKFATGYIEFIYTNNTFLPAISKYWRSDFSTPPPSGLVAVDTFRYNILGQLIIQGEDNRLSPEYNNTRRYEYNSSGNVTNVTISAQNGGTVFATPVVLYQGTRYDNKYNVFGSNQWLKYIFYTTDLSDYVYAMHSVNNAADWNWGFGGGYVATVTAAITYNTQGFANFFNNHLIDTDGNEFDFTEQCTSTCDATTPGNLPPVAPRLSNKFKDLKNITHIPLSTSR